MKKMKRMDMLIPMHICQMKKQRLKIGKMNTLIKISLSILCQNRKIIEWQALVGKALELAREMYSKALKNLTLKRKKTLSSTSKLLKMILHFQMLLILIHTTPLKRCSKQIAN